MGDESWVIYNRRSALAVALQVAQLTNRPATLSLRPRKLGKNGQLELRKPERNKPVEEAPSLLKKCYREYLLQRRRSCVTAAIIVSERLNSDSNSSSVHLGKTRVHVESIEDHEKLFDHTADTVLNNDTLFLRVTLTHLLSCSSCVHNITRAIAEDQDRLMEALIGIYKEYSGLTNFERALDDLAEVETVWENTFFRCTHEEKIRSIKEFLESDSATEDNVLAMWKLMRSFRNCPQNEKKKDEVAAASKEREKKKEEMKEAKKKREEEEKKVEEAGDERIEMDVGSGAPMPTSDENRSNDNHLEAVVVLTVSQNCLEKADKPTKRKCDNEEVPLKVDDSLKRMKVCEKEKITEGTAGFADICQNQARCVLHEHKPENQTAIVRSDTDMIQPESPKSPKVSQNAPICTVKSSKQPRDRGGRFKKTTDDSQIRAHRDMCDAATMHVALFREQNENYDYYAPKYLYNDDRKYPTMPCTVEELPKPRVLFEWIQEQKSKMGEPTDEQFSHIWVEEREKMHAEQVFQVQQGWIKVESMMNE